MSFTPRRRTAPRHLPLPSPSTRPSSPALGQQHPDVWSSDALPSSSNSTTKLSYSSFVRTIQPNKKKGGSLPQRQVYRVGDVVLVSVLRGGAGGVLPAVGVIIEMWERLPPPEKEDDETEKAEGEDDEDEDVALESEGMYVRVKWFQRIKELPRVMQDRVGGLNDPLKLFYTSSLDPLSEFSPPFLTSLILSPSSVLSSPPAKPVKSDDEDKEAGMSATSKRKKKPRGWEYVESDSDDETEIKIDESRGLGAFQHGRLVVAREYWCAGVCDSIKGLVWEFGEGGWTGWLEEVLKAESESGDLEKWRPKRPKVVKGRNSLAKAAGKPKRQKKAPGAVPKPTPNKRLRSGSRSLSPALAPSSDEDSGSEAEPFSSDEDDTSSSSGVSSDDDIGELPATTAGGGLKRKRAAAASTSKKTYGQGRAGGRLSAAERRAEKIKAAQYRKVKATVKRLKAPKARPMQDLPEAPLPQDPYLRALHLLHVGATPDTLPCREEQYADVLVKIEGVIEGGGGGCVYISGQPGTGKTATVHAVVSELRQKARDMELPPFEYVEINGLKIPDPGHAYVALWEAICGGADGGGAGVEDEDTGQAVGASAPGARKVSTKAALRGLEGHFSPRGATGLGGPRRCTYVVLMDELDQLFTAKQDVVYNFFNWPTLPGSQLIVIAVANTMDMPEKLAGRVKSRMGMERINFPAYTKDELVEIAQSRLIPHPNPDPSRAVIVSPGEHLVIEREALMLAAARTTGVTGDARRMLDVCRRAVEVAIQSATGGVQPSPVKTKQILAVLVEMSKNPTAQFIRNCSFYEKVLLAAVVRLVRKSGIGECEWGKIKNDHALLLSSLTLEPSSQTRLLPSEYLAILGSLTASYALSVSGPSGVGAASGAGATVIGDDRKVALGSGVEEGEVGRVLRDLRGEIGGERWRGMFE